MRSKKLILLSALLLLGGGNLPAAIADEATPETSGNAGGDQGAPSGKWAGQGGGRRRGGGGWQGRGLGGGGGLGGGLGGGMMKGGGMGRGMQDIEKISSLTQQQKDKIQAVFDGLKQETQTERQEMRAMFGKAGGGRGGRRGFGGNGGDASAQAAGADTTGGPGGNLASAGAEGNRARMKEIRESIKQKREAAWTKVQAILTPDQQKELDQIRQGQQPASNIQVKSGDEGDATGN